MIYNGNFNVNDINYNEKDDKDQDNALTIIQKKVV